MNEFSDVLARVGRRLPIHSAARSRILLELQADMDGLYDTYRGRGLDEATARAAVRERFDISDEALRELVTLHTSLPRRVLDGAVTQARRGWQEGVLLLFGAFFGLAAARMLYEPGFMALLGPWAWPLLGVGAVTLCLVLRELRLLLASEGQRPSVRSRGGTLDAILWLSLAQLPLAAGAVWLDLFRRVGAMQAEPAGAGPLFMGWLWTGSALLVCGHVLAMLGALAWFYLARRLSARENERLAALLAAD